MTENGAYGKTTEMYLKSICELARGDDMVPISSLAERLGISAVSATEMIHRMRKQGLVTHAPYKGVELTDDGRVAALSVIRRHRLWECFLVEALNLPWEEVHDLACNLEHAVGSEVTEALGEYLDQPDTCPHGNPIPSDPDGLRASNDPQLNELLVGESGIVQQIRPEERSVLYHLAQSGIKPGTHVSVEGIQPFNGPRSIKAGDKSVVLGRELAAHIVVRTPDSMEALSQGR